MIVVCHCLPMSRETLFDLDVRPLVAERRPPLPAILNAINRLGPGQSLRLTVPFEPMPLYAMLRDRGFSHETSRGPDGTWVVVFRR